MQDLHKKRAHSLDLLLHRHSLRLSLATRDRRMSQPTLTKFYAPTRSYPDSSRLIGICLLDQQH